MTILLAWLFADFLTGIVHWAQDILLDKPTRFQFLNGIKADNDLHHSRPGAMLRCTWWGNINTSAPYMWPVAFGLAIVGYKFLSLTLLFASFANLVHRFAHMHKSHLSWPVRLMQKTGLFISYDHHWQHHFGVDGLIKKEDTTGKYCPMTNWLNPVLDACRFFRVLEFVVRRT